MVSIPMSDGQFAAASTRLRANGIELSGPTGRLSKDGVTARYHHANATLTIEIIDKPFLLPLSLIESKLQAFVEESLSDDNRDAGTDSCAISDAR